MRCEGRRLVGIMLILPLLVSRFERDVQRKRGILSLGLCLSLCLLGFMAFMLFQHVKFDNAFAFSEGQASFCLRPHVSPIDHWYRLETFEPIWGNYLPSSSAFWRNHSPTPMVLLNLQFANPIYFVGTCVFLFAGWYRRLLTDGESTLGAGLLLLSYVGRAEEFCMGSQYRYAAAVIPVCIVLGRILHRMSAFPRLAIVGLWIVLTTAYAGYFAAWYFFV